jgi:photosystem II cytochrome c550
MVSLLSASLRTLSRSLLALCLALVACLAFPALAVQAAQWDAETLTVAGTPDGTPVTFSEADIKTGRKIFNESCGTCHAGGVTKTNYNVGLDIETLALATPPRDSVDALVDYMKDPTSYDGEFSISDIHPSLRSSDVFVKMRDLSEDDLRLIAGYILVAPKVSGIQWGGGKVYF